jgi:hypothetical protein
MMAIMCFFGTTTSRWRRSRVFLEQQHQDGGVHGFSWNEPITKMVANMTVFLE